ncbi:MAG: hypothetical protein CFH30_00698 [Alphaproteobacteria bacterium MarineAlpha8_Bin1]|nr:MAG: hypothetical protein CFH30_00698 [Alphaproteobacteria bacterium MarineAlpha8_Bin1]|tara:strand:- start:749 stop:1465 length:717 start_codon:yes stop_codon:yes gene_type:complete
MSSIFQHDTFLKNNSDCIKIIRSKKRWRTINIKIKNEMIEICCPFFTSTRKINLLIEEKFSWIQKKLSENRNLNIKKKKLRLLKKIFFKGKSILVKTKLDSFDRVVLQEESLLVNLKDDTFEYKMNLIKKWMKNESTIYLNYRLKSLALKHSIKYKSLEIKKYRSRWGSCSSSSDIKLNWKLIMLPIEVIDYVIVHELAHVIEPNHSKSFWILVHKMYPKYKKSDLWLKKNGLLVIDF